MENALNPVSLRLLVDDDPGWFPDPKHALREPNGLLAVGGDLSVTRLVSAYRQGIFPWFSNGEPILWWSPDPRMVLRPDTIHISRSLKKTIRRHVFRTTLDEDFGAVISACAQAAPGREETWIGKEMIAAYTRLHHHGVAHSVETRDAEGHLCGGLYGLLIGRVFFGESMFSRCSDASKLAMVALCRRLQALDVPLIDCQMVTPHLARMGAVTIPRRRFLREIHRAVTAQAGPFTDAPDNKN